MLFLLLSTLLITAAPALAAADTDSAPTADTATAPPAGSPLPPLDEGKNLYEQARFALAVAKLQEAIGVLETEQDASRRRGALTDAFLHLGLAFIGLSEREAARDAFKNVLRLDPGFRPDPEIYAPKVIELFEQARLGLPVSPAAAGGADDATAAAGAAPARTPGRMRFGFAIFARRARHAETTEFVRVPALDYDASSAWLEGPRGTTWGARLLAHLPSGRDRFELELENVDGAESSDSQPGVVAPQPLTDWVPADSNLQADVSSLMTVDIRWVRRLSSSRFWEIDLQCGYRRLWAELSHGTFISAGSQPVFDDWQHSTVSSHGLRVGVAGRRTLLGPLAVEMEAGYTVHVARDDYRHEQHFGNAWSTEPAEQGSPTEVRGGMDFAVRAHLAYKSRGALVAEYSWRHMGDYHAGELFQAGFRLSLVIGPSR